MRQRGRKRPTVSMSSLNDYFNQFLRGRVYLHNTTPRTREFYETAWKAFTRAQREAIPKVEVAPSCDAISFAVHRRVVTVQRK